MKKIDMFSKVLDSLNDDGKEKLLTSVKGLMKAQKVVSVEIKNKNYKKNLKDKCLCLKKVDHI